ncbi:hypothetical protein PAHAL_4G185800 [Panicum hallii]|jgi:hypothetical protein|uniref:Uncharacterized protein n=1 Tax=Panicum hallii TaxID=206008 RepID=A0A2T8JDB7_9POAL|nr:hypothetical protein PAHAL_4G185800 [Panicum hallii]
MKCQLFLLYCTKACFFCNVFTGYGAALANVTTNKESRLVYIIYPCSTLCKIVFVSKISFTCCTFLCSFTTCYLAAVLLKQFVKQHWQEDEENFVPPVVSA